MNTLEAGKSHALYCFWNQKSSYSKVNIQLSPSIHVTRLPPACCLIVSFFPPSLPSVIMTGAYNNFFRMFDRNTKRDVTLEASRESSKPRAILKPRRVCVGGKRRKDDISVDSLDFTKKILHTAWHPTENIIAIAATNNLYIFQDKVNSEMH